jgi:pseudaminic acid synthase
MARKLTDDGRVFIVAEIGANHNQKIETAIQLVLAAANSGADAVKIQMYTPDDLTLDRPDWKMNSGPWKGRSLYELYKETCMPYSFIPVLQGVAKEVGIALFTSVYAPETVDIAEKYDFPYYKTASFEIGYEDLHKRLAKTGKPIFISMGNADFPTIWKTLQIYRGNRDVYLLKSVPKYPALPEEYNLMTLYDIAKYVQGRIGISDHSYGFSSVVAIASVVSGARVIETHIMTDTKCPDAIVSRIHGELCQYVSNIRSAEKVMGKCFYGGESILTRKVVDGRSVRVPL